MSNSAKSETEDKMEENATKEGTRRRKKDEEQKNSNCNENDNQLSWRIRPQNGWTYKKIADQAGNNFLLAI